MGFVARELWGWVGVGVASAATACGPNAAPTAPVGETTATSIAVSSVGGLAPSAAPSAAPATTPLPQTSYEPLDAPSVSAARWLAGEAPAFAPVADAIDQKKYAEARNLLKPLVAALGTDRLELTMVAKALEGELATAAGEPLAAGAAYSAILALWHDGPKAVKEVESEPIVGGDAGPVRDQRLGRALTALGEATFYVAEKERIKADKNKMPVFHGAATHEAILKFVTDRVGPWIKDKQVLIETADAAYLKVVQIEPAAPPRWVVAAAERVGAMWSRFVDDFHAAPVPQDWKENPAIVQAYRDAIYSASDPFLARARAAYEKCVQTAVTYGVDDDAAARCRAWLDAHPSP